MAVTEVETVEAASGLSRLPWSWRRTGATVPPLVVWLPALLIGTAMLLPLAYLVIRAAGATEEAWSLLLRPRTAQILGRSVLLVATVTTASVALSPPLPGLCSSGQGSDSGSLAGLRDSPNQTSRMNINEQNEQKST